MTIKPSTTKDVAILQSNYIPWIGYFSIISKVDLFIFHDDLQYTKNDWRNRNKILLNGEGTWISIPVGISEKRQINEVKLNDSKWQKKHFNLIKENYQKAPFYKEFIPLFEFFYLEKKWDTLSELNQTFIKTIATEIFNLKTRFDNSEKYNLTLKGANRVIELLQKTKATSYLSGPSAINYLSDQNFKGTGIELKWMDYGYLKSYKQFNSNEFVANLSVIDMIFNIGENAKDYL
jgi:hypothetical protein